MHAASRVEGTLVRGRSGTGMRFDSHLTAALLTLLEACVRRQKKVQAHWYCERQ